MQPPNHARRQTPRVMLSCLTAVIAASLGGPVSGAFGAAGAANAPLPAGGSTAAAQSTTPAAPAPSAPPQAATAPTPTGPPPPAAPSPLPRKKPAPRIERPAKAPSTVSGPPPTVALQRTQRTTGRARSHGDASTSTGAAHAPANSKPVAPNNVAPAPQLAAAQAAALAAALASSAASVEALGFYRIPLFLLPIYKAAALRYGVPWQILAAINEVETNYGADLSVSSAGAVGWMQFMPGTWVDYGVDALSAGYADPYNPVDAIFAAARYLRAAGAARDLRSALLAYNHSQDYVASVLLRAKLISSYPRDVIATLTGLASARLPLTGGHVAWERARARAPKRPGSPQLVALTGAPDAVAVAVQDSRIIRLGRSRALGRFVVLQDVYGDEFTYAGLGSIAASYTRRNAAAARQTVARSSQTAMSAVAAAVGGKVRVFAHPGNPDAVAVGIARRTSRRAAPQLHPGALVSAGTELGRGNVPAGGHRGHIRFAIRPAGDPGTIDPRPVLASWAQLQSALRPQGARKQDPLVGATASDAVLLSRAELERAALSDPGVTLDACSRHQIASGRIDRRALAVIAYLSRSGLHPTVRAPGCGRGERGSSSTARVVRTIDLLAINGVAIARHQRAQRIADLTIRTLLALPSRCAPHAIWSLARRARTPSTHAAAAYWNRIRVTFQPRSSCVPSTPSAAIVDPHAARSSRAGLPSPPAQAVLGAYRWQQLIGRIAALPVPRVATRPSVAAIPDAPAR